MASAVKCDKCGAAELLSGLTNWLRVEAIGIDAAIFGDDPGPWDFCSWGCLRAYAGQRAPGV